MLVTLVNIRIIYNNKHSNFVEPLVKDNSVSIHHNIIYTLAIKMYKVAIEMFKVGYGMSPEIMNDIFNLTQDGGRAKSSHPPTSFSSVASAKVGIRPHNFLAFSFNPFATLV